MRPIDADALIKRLNAKHPSNALMQIMLAECIEEVKDAPTIESEQRWIPVTERLPYAEYGEGETVLATCEHRNPDYGDDYRWIRELYYNGGVWCFPTGETYEERVVAWMPLPQPYREGGD